MEYVKFDPGESFHESVVKAMGDMMTCGDPLEDEIDWQEWTKDRGVHVVEGALGRFSKRRYLASPVYSLVAAKREIAHDLLQAVYEGREREKREADKQFVGAV